MKARIYEFECLKADDLTYSRDEVCHFGTGLTSQSFGHFLLHKLKIVPQRISPEPIHRYESIGMFADGILKPCVSEDLQPITHAVVHFPTRRFIRAHFSDECVEMHLKCDGAFELLGKPAQKMFSLQTAQPFMVLMPIGAEAYFHVLTGAPEDGFGIEERWFRIGPDCIPTLENRLQRDARVVRRSLCPEKISWVFGGESRPFWYELPQEKRTRGINLSAGRTFATPKISYRLPEYAEPFIGQQLLAVLDGESKTEILTTGKFGIVHAGATGIGRSVGVVRASIDEKPDTYYGATISLCNTLWLDLGLSDGRSVQWLPDDGDSGSRYNPKTVSEFVVSSPPAPLMDRIPEMERAGHTVTSVNVRGTERWSFRYIP